MNIKIRDLADKPFTLALSSGFFGFYAHVGFLKAIEEIGLKPSAFSGTSAGAIVGAAAARGLSTKEIEKLFIRISRKDFWDPSLGLGLLRGQKFQRLLEIEIGDDFSQLQKPLRIPVFDIASRTTKVFTSGNLARAIRASCAVPFMFHPVRIDRRFYWDGGIQDKMGIYGIGQNEKILCHYLEGNKRDPYAFYEAKRDEKAAKARGKNLIQVCLKGLPQSHPFAMHLAPDIIEAAYKKSLIALKKISK